MKVLVKVKAGSKRRKRMQAIHIEELEIENKVEIDYDKLALSIAKAMQIAKENEEKEKADALAQWRKSMGYNDHDDKSGLLKIIYFVCNRIKMTFKMMFLPRKTKIVNSPTSNFIQGLTHAFFVSIQWLLTLLAIVFIGVYFYHPNVELDIYKCFVIGSFALISFLLSRVFRLMAIEIDQMSNREQVLGVFTAVIAVFPLVEKVVELFQGVS